MHNPLCICSVKKYRFTFSINIMISKMLLNVSNVHCPRMKAPSGSNPYPNVVGLSSYFKTLFTSAPRYIEITKKEYEWSHV